MDDIFKNIDVFESELKEREIVYCRFGRYILFPTKDISLRWLYSLDTTTAPFFFDAFVRKGTKTLATFPVFYFEP